LLHNLRAAFPNDSIEHEGELTTISRFPIRSSCVYRPPKNDRQLLEVTLEVHGQALRVVNLHFPFANFRGPFSSKPKPPRTRWELTELLLRLNQTWLDQKTPLLIAGDFNTTPRGPLYSSLRKRYQNAFEQVGWGFGFTYNSRMPVVRIDHVWFNANVRAARAFAINDPASDHRPFVTDLELLNEP
jgi:vancomycin resistance protein VanJ